MFELPLLPMKNGYGRAQRQVAARHGVTLIPKRCFVELLATPGATVDGIHLSVAGQRQMAELVWGFAGTALTEGRGSASRMRSATGPSPPPQ